MKWEKIRTCLAAKAAALVLAIVVLLTGIISAGVILFNIEEGTYSKTSAQIEETTNNQIALAISNDILSGINSDPKLPNSIANKVYSNLEPLEEGFGYVVTQLKPGGKEKVLEKVINPELQSATHRTFTHENTSKGEVRIDVYFDIENMLENGIGMYTRDYVIIQKIYDLRYIAIGTVILSVLVFIALVISLLCAAGWTKDGLKANLIDRIPFDLLCVLWILFTFAGVSTFYGCYSTGVQLIANGSFLVVFAVWVEALCMTFATRVKLGKWWRNTICYFIWKQVKSIFMGIADISGKIVKQLPFIWKAGLAAGIVCFIGMICVFGAATASDPGIFFFLALLLSVFLIFASLYFSVGLQKLKIAGEKLAAGELDYHVDKKGLYLDFAAHADHLNQIANGMNQALEERMKSERFKTELITNVSHDIKTPLTSIINYVDLLEKENIEEETIKEYIDVLNRQSYRLKKLLEDLIDASKAATGAVKIDMEPCQVGILMMQTLGEYEERLQAEELKVITSIPEEDIVIMADGRQLWRVFDNLLANICKYSQPHTRVYIDLYQDDGTISIIYKNISRYEMNAKGEVFLERFMRGDRSRHTEGSGLGLSIAQSLINLQGGTLEVIIDGDLFKVIIQFKQ